MSNVKQMKHVEIRILVVRLVGIINKH